MYSLNFSFFFFVLETIHYTNLKDIAFAIRNCIIKICFFYILQFYLVIICLFKLILCKTSTII